MLPLLRTHTPFCAERTLTEQSRNASLRINLFVSAVGDYYPSERHTVRVANPGCTTKGRIIRTAATVDGQSGLCMMHRQSNISASSY